MNNTESIPPISGIYYDGKTSRIVGSYLLVSDDGTANLDGVSLQSFQVSDLDIPARVGNSACMLSLPMGGFFETRENDKVDVLRRKIASEQRFSLHRIERAPLLICVLLFCSILGAYLLIDKGVPYASEKLAHQLPPEWSARLGDGVLSQLDKLYLSPTNLPLERQSELRQLFSQYLPESEGFDYVLHFRKGDLIGPNALALPNGHIVVTDELVALADNDEQILSVMLHEFGHVEHRHSMRMVLESSGVALLFTMFIGDAEFVLESIAAVPSIFLQARFSRDHEWEADGYALERMQEQGLDPKHFSDIMRKLTFTPKLDLETSSKHKSKDEAIVSAETVEGSSSQTERPEGSSNDDAKLLRYLSSHPDSADRIDRFEGASKTFQAN